MRRVLMSGLASVVLLCGPWSERGMASEPDAGDVGFLALGVGMGSTGPAGVASLNFSRGNFFYGARVAGAEEFTLFGPEPALSDKDVSLLVGVCSRTRTSFFSAAAGLGVMESVRRGRFLSSGGFLEGSLFERIDRSGPALPFDVKATMHGRAFGIGVNLFGALGRHESYFGVALVLQAGTWARRR